MKNSVRTNTSTIIDMTYSELLSVNEYDEPGEVPAINWITNHSSFECKHNGEAGVYDFIFNLDMLESLIDNYPPPPGLADQLMDIRSAGYSYILFNQGC